MHLKYFGSKDHCVSEQLILLCLQIQPLGKQMYVLNWSSWSYADLIKPLPWIRRNECTYL